MKALVYRRSIPRYLACAAASRLFPRRFFPWLAPLSLLEVPFDPPVGWVPLTPRMCGICGSDLGLLRGMESPLLEPYASLPFILGHEMVATVAERTPGCDLPVGTRVVVEPGLPCVVRGLSPCPSCQAGSYNRCERFLDGDLPAGSFLGYTRRAGGAMAERTAAHPAKLIPLPAELADEDAVLTDSLASALQPVLEHFPADDALVLVVGAGILGQHVVRCLRALGSKARILVSARHPKQADLARAGGADAIVRAKNRAELAAALGARFVPSTLGGGNIEGGADVVFDCVGGSRTFADGLVALRAGGKYVMVGATARLARCGRVEPVVPGIDRGRFVGQRHGGRSAPPGQPGAHLRAGRLPAGLGHLPHRRPADPPVPIGGIRPGLPHGLRQARHRQRQGGLRLALSGPGEGSGLRRPGRGNAPPWIYPTGGMMPPDPSHRSLTNLIPARRRGVLP